MSRLPSVPIYRLHKQSGQAVVTLRDPATGRRRDVLLGRYGTPESRQEYTRVLAEWEAAGRRSLVAGRQGPTPRRSPTDITVNEVTIAYWRHCQTYYVTDGRPTKQQHRIKTALRPVKALYGTTPASEFGPLALKAVREQLVARGYARKHVNQLVGCVKGMFKWATGEELVNPSVYHGLLAVSGLKAGRTTARETKAITPVSDELVEATLSHLSRQVAAMVRLQRLTGMRSGEVVSMRITDLDRAGPIWLYRPLSHKTEHHGKERVVALGPRAQAVLHGFLNREPSAYLFSPREAEEERRQAMRDRRKTRVQPSQVYRKKANPRKGPGGRFTADSYQRSIKYACERAKLAPWHPHQLRHAHATEVRRQFGLEAAQVALGHGSADVTQVYAQRDLRLAVNVAAALG
jgi:integrase